MVLFSSLGFLSWFCRVSGRYCFFVVLFSSLSFLLWFSGGSFSFLHFFFVFLSGLSFLLGSCFFVLFVVGSFCWCFSRCGSGGSRCRSSSSFSSESSGRQTHQCSNGQR